MDLELQEKVVLVTGGSKGIGLACARAFAREGGRVAIAARTAADLEAAVRGLRAEGIEAHAECVDLRDAQAVQAAVARVEARLGPIDVLVNSAGAARHHPPDSGDSARWSDGMSDKYFPTVHAIDAVLPRMAARGRGAIVNIVGAGGKLASASHLSGGAANAALLLVTAGLAKAWGPKGLRVNAINPGTIETGRVMAKLQVQSRSSGKPVDELRKASVAAIPLRRHGQPEEIAAVAVFLASARASYVNGATVAVDGGVTSLP